METEEKRSELELSVGRGLANAVRTARANGASWNAIGMALGTTRQAAQQRFGFVDDELRRTGMSRAVLQRDGEDEIAHAVEPVVQAAAEEKAPIVLETNFKAMTNEELAIEAAEVMGDLRHRRDSLLRIAKREAIVITLYNRGVPQTEIAPMFGITHQRINQIVKKYYDRMEVAWEQERKMRQGKA